MSNRTQWTDVKFKESIKAICDGLGHFPSNNELQELGRCDLASQISKRGGWLKVSKDVGVKRAFSDSDFGWHGEDEVVKLLKKNGFKCERQTRVKFPFDILVNENVRVDVKTAKYAEYGPCRGWFYRMGKMPQADLVVLFQSDTKDIYVLPWYVCPPSNITISRSGGIYEQFKNGYEIIKNICHTRTCEQTSYTMMVGLRDKTKTNQE